MSNNVNAHKVEFTCSDNAARLMYDLLYMLQTVSDMSATRRIRIGGMEAIFCGFGPDKIDNLKVDGCSVRYYEETIPEDAKPGGIGETLLALRIVKEPPQAVTPVTPSIPTSTNAVDSGIGGTPMDATQTVTNPVSGTTGLTGATGTPPGDGVDSSSAPSGLDSNQQDKVEEILTDWTSKNRMFTAFDVTRELRRIGMRVKHGNVKSFVHYLFQTNLLQNNYDRGLASIPGANPPPFIYYPMGADISAYDPTGASDNIVG